MPRPRKSPSTRPFRSVASRLTAEHEVAINDSAAAELRGDWATAHERHRSVPMFAQSRHGANLQLMAELGDGAPDWLRTRFLVTLVARWECYGQPRRAGRVLRTVMPVIYPHPVPFEAIGCEHVEQVGPWIFARDWVVQQADAHELGGLRDLLELPAAARAVATSSVLETWCRAPMGGWRILGSEDGVLLVADAATGEEFGLCDLGLTLQLEVGTHVLGRVVPTSSAPGRVFDRRPLPVDERTARLVAGSPDRWLGILGARARARALPPAFSHMTDSSISADLPRHAWGALLGHPVDDLPRPPWTLATQALKAALRLTSEASDVRRQHVLISELLLDEALDEAILDRFALPTYQAAWAELAAVLPPHAARRCDRALWLISALTDVAG